MSVTTTRLKPEIEQAHWQQTLEALESASQGRVVDASKVHSWLSSWGTENERDCGSQSLK